MEKSITSTSWVKFFDQSMARLRFKFNGKSLTETEILNLLSSTDSKIRKNAQKFWEYSKENIFNFSIMNTISRTSILIKI